MTDDPTDLARMRTELHAPADEAEQAAFLARNLGHEESGHVAPEPTRLSSDRRNMNQRPGRVSEKIADKVQAAICDSEKCWDAVTTETDWSCLEYGCFNARQGLPKCQPTQARAALAVVRLEISAATSEATADAILGEAPRVVTFIPPN